MTGVAGRWAGGLSVAALAVVALTIAGCAVPPPPQVDAAAIPVASVPSAESAEVATDAPALSDAQTMGSAVQFSMLVPASFPDEPRGDVATSTSPARVFAHISAVSTSPASVTFDVAQYYQGDAAAVEAAKDKKPAPDDDIYERDRFVHAQTVRVAASTGVIAQNPRSFDVLYGRDGYSKLTVRSFEEFERRFSAGDQSAQLRSAGYWLVIDGDGIRSIAEQFAP
jgi:hypothetical protein